MSAFGGKADVNHWAVECLLIAKSGLLGATPQGHSSPRSYRPTACGRSRGRQSGAASMIGTRQATYDRDPPNELQVDVGCVRTVETSRWRSVWRAYDAAGLAWCPEVVET